MGVFARCDRPVVYRYVVRDTRLFRDLEGTDYLVCYSSYMTGSGNERSRTRLRRYKCRAP